MPTTTARELQECIEHCAHCGDACLKTTVHCLDMGGEHASREHQTLLHDCADICELAARFMSRRSPHHAHTCRECAEICERCAEDCERLASGDAMMRECAEVCRRCAQSCQRMAAAAV
jgi:hypothetical protein